MRLAFPAAFLSLVVLACGGKVVLDAAGAGGSTSTAKAGGGGAGGCACTGPAPVVCGQRTCTTGEYCQVSPPGIEPPDGGAPGAGYACEALPADCVATPTCACLGEAIGAGEPCSPAFGAMCRVDAEGGITVVCVDA
jgi:hypothetical protein